MKRSDINPMPEYYNSLFKSFSDESLRRTGVSWDYEVSVLAMGFMMLGHQVHHFNVIEEKYYPLLEI